MNVVNFFNSDSVALPRERKEKNFCRFLQQMMDDYIAAVKSLDPNCPIGSRILAQRNKIVDLAGQVRLSVEFSLNGKPDDARKGIYDALDFVSKSLTDMLSKNVSPAGIQRLYRASKTKAGETLSRERLFHVPFNNLNLASSDRYSLPGSPCLYLGGSLHLCIAECNIKAVDLPMTAIAEFGVCKGVKFLDFGYSPTIIGEFAHGRLLTQVRPNQKLDDLIVNFAVCWPLIAASSIIRMSDKSSPEYIVPQIILQWLMDKNHCQGIRYFSTRLKPQKDAIWEQSNFAFPARNPTNKTSMYCQELKNLFMLNKPVLWQCTTNGVDIGKECNDNSINLCNMAKGQLP